MKRGLGSIVAFVVIALITVVGASIFLGAFFKNVSKQTSDDSASCFGIDLEVKSCYYFNNLINYLLPPEVTPIALGEYAILVNVERFPGGGDINGLKFVIKDNLNKEYALDPVNMSTNLFIVDTDYSDLVEYTSDNAVVRGISSEPAFVSVGAVVGKSRAVCSPVRTPVKCEMFRTS